MIGGGDMFGFCVVFNLYFREVGYFLWGGLCRIVSCVDVLGIVNIVWCVMGKVKNNDFFNMLKYFC